MSKSTILAALFLAADTVPGKWTVDLTDLGCEFLSPELRIKIRTYEGNNELVLEANPNSTRADEDIKFSTLAISKELGKELRGYHQGIVRKATADAFQRVKELTAATLVKHEEKLEEARKEEARQAEYERRQNLAGEYLATTDLAARVKVMLDAHDEVSLGWDENSDDPDPWRTVLSLDIPFDDEAWAAIQGEANRWEAIELVVVVLNHYTRGTYRWWAVPIGLENFQAESLKVNARMTSG